MKNKICNISLFSAILTCVATVSGDAFGAQNTGWSDARAQRSYADAYNQVAVMQQQQEYIETQSVPVVQTASATRELPVEVEDKKIKEKILNNDPNAPTAEELERCAMTDIRGVFKWGVPQSGARKNSKPQCVAVVDLVYTGPQMDFEDTSAAKVLATTTVAAGDAIKCNIDEFPEEGYSIELENIEVPADDAPTLKDVEKVMDKEQTQNAGFKIAAAAIVGGLAGNMLGPKKSGDEKLLGTDKKQLGTTALGAGVAAGLMAASSYSGKVAGDTIKSTAVNATAGMIAGNMAAGLMGSNSVLATTKCTVKENNKTSEKDCVPGRLATISTETINSEKDCYTNSNGSVLYCKSATQPETYERTNKSLANIVLEGDITLNPYGNNNFSGVETKCLTDNNELTKCNTDGVRANAEPLYKIKSANTTNASRPGYAVFDKLPNKAFGYKVSDWEKLSKNTGMRYYLRNTNDQSVGTIMECIDTNNPAGCFAHENIVFTPSARSAQDGSIIDLSNEARAKSTIIGTAAGGALGGFTGYQGAQSEIVERWLTAVQEYEGSLTNFVCKTGGRFLYYYNGHAAVPPMPNSISPTNSQE